MGVIAGVAGLDGTGVTGRTESVAERAGEGGIMSPGGPAWLADLGAGATMLDAEDVGVGNLADNGALGTSGL